VVVALSSPSAVAQTPPSATEIAAYDGLLAAAHNNDVAAAEKLLAAGADPNRRDGAGRTPVHVAAFAASYAVLPVLVRGGADIKEMEYDRYDAITIAAVANDVRMLKLAIDLGGDPKAMTSPYDGTALIAAAHPGHVEVVKTLIAAGSPLDHVNNLVWTALIEAVVLGDGGERHVEIVRALVEAGADKTIADRRGTTPRQLAEQRGYAAMVDLLK
jgi:uncharacterized protein